MTTPDPDALRLRWVEQEAGVYDNDDDSDTHHWDEPDTLDWEER